MRYAMVHVLELHSKGGNPNPVLQQAIDPGDWLAYSADLEPSTSAGTAPYATHAVRCRCPIGAGRLALAPRATFREGHGSGQGAHASETRPGQV